MNFSDLTIGDYIAIILFIIGLFLAPMMGTLFSKYYAPKLPSKDKFNDIIRKRLLVILTLSLCIYNVWTFDLSTFTIVFTIISFGFLYFVILHLMIMKIYRVMSENIKKTNHLEITSEITKALRLQTDLITASFQERKAIIETLSDIVKNDENISKSTIDKIEKVKSELMDEVNKKKNKKKRD